jgi:DNA-binding transcriptional LysR family regulator
VQTQLTNIPTDLLRTLIALVDLRSFTRAAQSLGITQPAVSAQIRRLQALLGGELLDKSAPGVMLTAKGEIVVSYARRLLSINDQILDLSSQSNMIDRLRIGIPNDHHENVLLRLIADFRSNHPEFQVQVCSQSSEILLGEFRRGEFDLALAFADELETMPTRWSWNEEVAWCVASPSLLRDDGPIPLVVLGESSLTRRISVKALKEAGQPYEIVYVGKSYSGLVGAVAAGLGVACLAKRAIEASGLPALDQTPRLPRLANTNVGIYISTGRESSAVVDLAERIAAMVRPAQANPAVRRIAAR